MISVQTVIALLFIHFVADFLLQSDWMAINKSKNWDALLLHTSVYAIWFCMYGFWFYAFTLVSHTITDAITSRITSRLWQANKRHWFFVVIGLDQFIHYTTLLFSYVYLR